jgi:hypothetical protein
VRKAVVIVDAGLEAILATVLLMGIVYAVIDEHDFPGPASDIVIALFAAALYVVALVLATLVKDDRLDDAVLGGLAAANAAFALLLIAWIAVADGFSATGETVVWTTAVALLALALAQAVARARR